MRAEACPACHLPLMSLKDAKPWLCLGCVVPFVCLENVLL